METVTNVPAKRERKRLSLDVFQEKSIGTPKLNAIGGAEDQTITLSTWLCTIISVVSVLMTMSSDTAKACKTNDCH